MERSLKCRHCGDVIGAYEPMIVVCDGQARSTSRSAERESGPGARECYHRACYARAQNEAPTGLDEAT